MSKSKEIKSKIKSIKNTEKITHAMELLSATKMRKSQNVMHASRPFTASIIELIYNLAYNCNNSHDFLIKRQPNNIGVLIIGSDRGLCGGLNINLFRKCYNYVKSWQTNHGKSSVTIATIGEKAKIFVTGKLKSTIIASQEKIGEKPKIQQFIGVIKVLLQEYMAKKIDGLYIAYNEFETTIKQNPVIKQLLPIAPVDFKSTKLPTEYIFEPNANQLLDLLLNRYIESLIYQALLENIASEQSARMLAMKNATDNANQIIDDLNLYYNKERQMLITKEIAEIVSGSV